MRPNIFFSVYVWSFQFNSLLLGAQIRTFTCDDANSPKPKSLERVSVGRGQT